MAVVFVVSGRPHVAVPGVLGLRVRRPCSSGRRAAPGVAASTDELYMRTLFENVSIPLASIDTVLVRRYLLVAPGGRKYICPAISRSLRKTVRTR